MTKCAKCEEQLSLPYTCRRCQKQFCPKHRLPESHDCVGLRDTERKDGKDVPPSFSAPAQQTGKLAEPRYGKENPRSDPSDGPVYSFRTDYSQRYAPARTRVYFSKTEAKHLSIATVLLVLFSLSWMISVFPLYIPPTFDWSGFILLTLILFVSFMPHELAHKFTAQRYGLLAEFRIIPNYALLTIVTLVLPTFKIFAPGAVMIAGNATAGAYGKTSAAGPATNIVIGCIMVGLQFIFPAYIEVFFVGAYLSGWLAFFNMLPIFPFDGEKVLRWSKLAFAALLLASLALFIYSFSILTAF